MKQVKFLMVILFSLFAIVANSQKVTISQIGEEFKRPGDEVWDIKFFQKDSFYCRGTDRTACMFKTTFDTVIKVVSADPNLPFDKVKDAIQYRNDFWIGGVIIKNPSVKKSSWSGFSYTYPIQETFIYFDSKNSSIQKKIENSETEPEMNHASIWSLGFLVGLFIFTLAFVAKSSRWNDEAILAIMIVASSWICMTILFLLGFSILLRSYPNCSDLLGVVIMLSLLIIAIIIVPGNLRYKTIDFIDGFALKGRQQILLCLIGLSFAGMVGTFAVQSSWVKGFWWASLLVILWGIARLAVYFDKEVNKERARLSY